MIADNRKSERHLSSFHVELLRLGEASTEERAWIERHLKGCRRCSELAVAFQSHRVEFGGRRAAVGPSLPTTTRAAPGWRRAARIALGVALPAAAAVALIISAQRPREPGVDPAFKRGGQAAEGFRINQVAAAVPKQMPVKLQIL